MLLIGLTGGIGSGKSTVARRLAERGAVVVDADVIAREVVAPGTAGLAEIAERFGPDVLDADGALDRPAMAAKVFGDDEARAALNAITHPKIAERSAERFAQAPSDAIVVHDMPLLVELGMTPNYHVTVVVDAPEDVRVERLVGRGLEASDATARIRAQATESQRREVADVWLDNSGSEQDLVDAVDALWDRRLVPFEDNLRHERGEPRGSARVVEPDPEWPRGARRLAARLEHVVGEYAVRIDHVGSTSVPGLQAKDVLDFQVALGSMEDADAVSEALTAAGFPRWGTVVSDDPRPDSPDPREWAKRVHASADPQRPVNVHVRENGRANWRFSLLFRDWLRSDDQARAEYARLKLELADAYASDDTNARYVDGKRPWFDKAWDRAESWARRTGWQPPEA